VRALVNHDQQRYLRGLETLFAAWRAYARGSVDAVVQHLPGATTAVFPSEPEGVYATVGFRDLGRMLEYFPPEP
jgi:hypothetical protein